MQVRRLPILASTVLAFRTSPWTSAALTALLSACAGVRTPDVGQPVELAAGEAFAFGRLRLFEAGGEQPTWSSEPLDVLLTADVPELRLALYCVEREERRLYAPIGEDGWFAWILPEGTWLVYRSSRGEPIWHDVLAAFQVHARPQAQLLGELVIAIERNSDPNSLGYSVQSLATRLDAQAAREVLARRHPGAGENSVERPLVVDPELRGLFDDWKPARARQVLERLGLAPMDQ